MFGLRVLLTISILKAVIVHSSLGDIEIFVTDRIDDFSGCIHRINKTSNLVTTLDSYKIIRPVAISYDELTQRIYWSDVMSKEIRTSRLDGSDEKSFLHLETTSIADGLTIDDSNRLLFYTDTGNDFIVSLPLDPPHSRTTVVDSGLEKPRGIVVYPAKRLIIWTDWSAWASVQLCKYDGTGRKTIVNTDIRWPNGITLDRENEIIYWCDADNHRIESVKIDGSQRTIILTEPNTHYYSLYFFENSLFLTDWKSDSVREISPTGTEISRINVSRFRQLTGIVIVRTSRCPDGRYGDDCTGVCGHCAGNSPCHKKTGLCIGGCQDGYHGNCTLDVCKNQVTASLCDEECTCEVHCQAENGTCQQGCHRMWYMETCGGSDTESSSTVFPQETVDVGYVASENITETSSSDGTVNNKFRFASVSTPESTKPSTVAVLLGIIVVMAIACGISTIYAFKYRRDYLRQKTYDHLQYHRKSVSTTVTRCSHDYTGMEDEVSPMTPPNKVCPDILRRDPPQLEKEEWGTEEAYASQEEPRYMSVNSLVA